MSDVWVARITIGIIIGLFALRAYYQYKFMKFARQTREEMSDILYTLAHRSNGGDN